MDYTAIRKEYETTKTSFVKLQEKYNINYKKLERKAQKEEWIKYDPTTQNPTKSIVTKETLPPKVEVPKELLEYLYDGKLTPTDRVLVELYINSYKLFKSIEQNINYEDMSKNETIRLQQLQIEKNNLSKYAKEFRELRWRTQ